MNIINLNEFKAKKIEQQHIAYYGTPVKIEKVKRPQLTLVREISEEEAMEALKGSIDMNMLNKLFAELNKEGIDTTDIEIIKPDPSIPW